MVESGGGEGGVGVVVGVHNRFGCLRGGGGGGNIRYTNIRIYDIHNIRN